MGCAGNPPSGLEVEDYARLRLLVKEKGDMTKVDLDTLIMGHTGIPSSIPSCLLRACLPTCLSGCPPARPSACLSAG